MQSETGLNRRARLAYSMSDKIIGYHSTAPDLRAIGVVWLFPDANRPPRDFLGGKGGRRRRDETTPGGAVEYRDIRIHKRCFGAPPKRSVIRRVISALAWRRRRWMWAPSICAEEARPALTSSARARRARENGPILHELRNCAHHPRVDPRRFYVPKRHDIDDSRRSPIRGESFEEHKH